MTTNRELNNKIAKKIEKAVKRIDKGKYITEEEFFKDSPLKKELKETNQNENWKRIKGRN